MLHIFYTEYKLCDGVCMYTYSTHQSIQQYVQPQPLPHLKRDGEAVSVRHEVLADAESVDRHHHGQQHSLPQIEPARREDMSVTDRLQ